MKLSNEIKEYVYKYDMDCTDEEKETLKKIAIERFAKDEAAQIQYAVISILTQMLIDNTDKKKSSSKIISKKEKERKNGNKNNRSRKDVDSSL